VLPKKFILLLIILLAVTGCEIHDNDIAFYNLTAWGYVFILCVGVIILAIKLHNNLQKEQLDYQFKKYVIMGGVTILANYILLVLYSPTFSSIVGVIILSLINIVPVLEFLPHILLISYVLFKLLNMLRLLKFHYFIPLTVWLLYVLLHFQGLFFNEFPYLIDELLRGSHFTSVIWKTTALCVILLAVLEISIYIMKRKKNINS